MSDPIGRHSGICKICKQEYIEDLLDCACQDLLNEDMYQHMPNGVGQSLEEMVWEFECNKIERE